MENNQKEIKKTWANITITEDMPLYLIIDFLNILNSRLSAVETIIKVPHPQKPNETISLSEFYELINTLKAQSQQGE